MIAEATSNSEGDRYFDIIVLRELVTPVVSSHVCLEASNDPPSGGGLSRSSAVGGVVVTEIATVVPMV